MNKWDEEYWRRLARAAQGHAATHYRLAQLYAATPGCRQLARVYQNLAHESQLRAMARLGLAAEERRAAT